MKNSTKWLLYFASVIAFALVMNACEKDDDDDDPQETEEQNSYYGNWESAAYLSLDQVTWEKMVFSFTNTTFEDKVYQGPNAESLGLAVGMKGDIDGSVANVLGVEINEVAALGGSYYHKDEDSAVFYSTFNMTLGRILDEEFDATYSVDGESMQLILPIKVPGTTLTTTDTLHLTKMTE